MTLPRIDRDRLWQRYREIAAIGAPSACGRLRPAFSAEAAAAEALVAGWCAPLAPISSRDSIGNLFFRQAGHEVRARAVALGGHLDTAPNGGHAAGGIGVLSALEVLAALADAKHVGRAPIELAVWVNGCGSRFRPGLMGSRVHAGDLPLAAALASNDAAGVNLAQAMLDRGVAGDIPPGLRKWACWLELAAERGALLAAHRQDVGIVTGAAAVRGFRLTVTGEPGDAGSSPLDTRSDSLAAAAAAILAVERAGQTGEPRGRSACTWIENLPNAAGAVPTTTRLDCELRHADAARLDLMESSLREALHDIVSRRNVGIDIEPDLRLDSVQFDTSLTDLLRRKSRVRRFATRDMLDAAGHDAAILARLCPAAMLFVPEFSPDDSNAADRLAQGATVLLDTVLELAG